MKPSITVSEALKNTPAIRTEGDLCNVLSNVLLGLVRKEISATDAEAAVSVTDGICNVINTGIKARRLHMDMQKAAGKVPKLVAQGQMLINGEASPESN